MTVDPMLLVGGSDIPIMDGLHVRQPTLDDIRQPEVGLARYQAYLSMLCMTAKDILAQGDTGLPQSLLEHLHAFDLMTGIGELREPLHEALGFFIREPLLYAEEERCFKTDSGRRIGRDNYEQVRNVILYISCVKPPETEAPKFMSDTARKIFEKIKAGREKSAKSAQNRDLSLHNVISKLSSRHPSYNLLNIWGLTVWQLFDQFGCTCVNTQLDVYGLRWAAWGKDEFDFSQWYKHTGDNA